MNLEKYLDIQPEIKAALGEGKPVVALESTIPVSYTHLDVYKRQDPETEGAYRAFMLVNWLVLMPWLRFIPGWLAGALVCRYIALPERKVRVFCRKLGWLCLTPYAVLLGLAVLVRAAGLDYSSPVAAVYNGIINHPAYMIIPGALLSLARRRPPVKAEQ